MTPEGAIAMYRGSEVLFSDSVRRDPVQGALVACLRIAEIIKDCLAYGHT